VAGVFEAVSRQQRAISQELDHDDSPTLDSDPVLSGTVIRFKEDDCRE
jgi:hypothetical protein